MTVQLEQPVKQTPPRDIQPDVRPVASEAGVDVAPLKPEDQDALKAPAGAWGY
jgi:hypothetical protein